MRVQFERLTQWPREHDPTPAHERRGSPFRASHSHTLKLLDYELAALGAGSVVLQVDIPANKIRLDGLPHSNAPIGAGNPGVVLSFETADGKFMYPCDRFATWKQNLRALALTLEKLRAVDRYGVSTHGEQYVGWKALSENVDADLSPEAAATIIARTAGVSDDDDLVVVVNNILHAGELMTHYRRALRYSHPDHGGSRAAFDRLQAARRILERCDG
jgi:hypothetical protein